MQLIVDTGNTQSKLAIFQGNDLIKLLVVDQLDKTIIEQLLVDYDLQSAIVSNVAVANESVLAALNTRLKLLVLPNPNLELPFINRYATAHTLGSDRIANVAAAALLHPGSACLVIDAGTCLKFDFLSHEGEYLGGNISPGLNMRAKAMNYFTARLPLVEIANWPDNFIGNSTETSLITGVTYGMLGEIESSISRYEAKYPNLITLLTGGDGQFFASALKNSIFAHSELTLHGLNYILTINA